MKYTAIRVLAARSVAAVDNGQCDEVCECDTLTQARTYARHVLTPAFQRANEMSTPLNYSRITAEQDGTRVTIGDFYRKGYTEPTESDRQSDRAPVTTTLTPAKTDAWVEIGKYDGKAYEFEGEYPVVIGSNGRAYIDLGPAVAIPIKNL